ncbi:MAG: hypothetical protein PHC99_09055, partial [Methylococcales bacterium]|nr:hypothetical protein [Methylococcales bacterium]
MIEKLLAFLQSLFLLPLGDVQKSPDHVEITPENALEIFNKLLAEQEASKPESANVTHVVPTQCTTPIFTNTENPQPTSLLRKLAPLRFLSESTLAQIEHKTLHYTAESVVFIVGQRTDYAYYLLQGGVEMRPQ